MVIPAPQAWRFLPATPPCPHLPPCSHRRRRLNPAVKPLPSFITLEICIAPCGHYLEFACPPFPPFLCTPIPVVLTHSSCLPDVLCSLMPLSQASSAALAISCSACQAGARDTGQKQQKDRVVVVLPFHHSWRCSRVQPDVLILTVMTISPFRVFSISSPQREDECLAQPQIQGAPCYKMSGSVCLRWKYHLLY